MVTFLVRVDSLVSCRIDDGAKGGMRAVFKMLNFVGLGFRR